MSAVTVVSIVKKNGKTNDTNELLDKIERQQNEDRVTHDSRLYF